MTLPLYFYYTSFSKVRILRLFLFVYHTYIPLTLYSRRRSRDILEIPRSSRFTELAMRNTADVTGGKPIAVRSQSISGVNAINLLVVFYDMHGRKRKCYSFILSRTPLDTYYIHDYKKCE
jgi:hypothetical protein